MPLSSADRKQSCLFRLIALKVCFVVSLNITLVSSLNNGPVSLVYSYLSMTEMVTRLIQLKSLQSVFCPQSAFIPGLQPAFYNDCQQTLKNKKAVAFHIEFQCLSFD